MKSVPICCPPYSTRPAGAAFGASISSSPQVSGHPTGRGPSACIPTPSSFYWPLAANNTLHCPPIGCGRGGSEFGVSSELSRATLGHTNDPMRPIRSCPGSALTELLEAAPVEHHRSGQRADAGREGSERRGSVDVGELHTMENQRQSEHPRGLVRRRSSFFDIQKDEIAFLSEQNDLSASGRKFLEELMRVRGLSGAQRVIEALQRVEQHEKMDWLVLGQPDETFEIMEEIGRGCYATVFRARERSTGKYFAAKRVDLADSDMFLLRNEVLAYLTCEDSRQTIRLRCLFVHHDRAWLMVELCVASVLDVMIRLEMPLTENEIRAVLAYSILGLEAMHASSIVHRDIKAANILLCSDGSVKLADFGVAGIIETEQSENAEDGINRKLLTDLAGSPHWIAPEVAANETGYDEKADVWSLGVTAIELANGEPPNADLEPHRVIYLADLRDPPALNPKDGWSDKFMDFLNRCLQKEPKSRATISELSQHPWMKRKLQSIRNHERSRSTSAANQEHPAECLRSLLELAQQMNEFSSAEEDEEVVAWVR